MWLDVISFYTYYIFFSLWDVMLMVYVLTHALWAFYFRYQGVYNWYLAFLPFVLQFMKADLMYESKTLPILYTISCIVCSLFFPLWLIPWLFSKAINHKLYSAMFTDVNLRAMSVIPFAGALHMLTEVLRNERDESG